MVSFTNIPKIPQIILTIKVEQNQSSRINLSVKKLKSLITTISYYFCELKIIIPSIHDYTPTLSNMNA